MSSSKYTDRLDADKKRKEEAESRNHAESLIHQAKKAVIEAGDKLPAETKTEIETETETKTKPKLKLKPKPKLKLK